MNTTPQPAIAVSTTAVAQPRRPSTAPTPLPSRCRRASRSIASRCISAARAASLLDASDRPGARAVLLRTLDRCDATLGADNPDAAALRNLLGIVGKFLGTFDEAAAHYARALEIYRVAAGRHRDAHHNLGGLAHSRGDLITAERETRHELELHVASSGAAHPDTAADRGQLAAILSELGRNDEAERELRRAADDFAATLGPDHVEVASRARRSAPHCAASAGSTKPTLPTARASPCASARRARITRCSRPTLLNLSALCSARGDAEAAQAFAQRAADVLGDGAVTDDHPHLLAARERLAELAS